MGKLVIFLCVWLIFFFIDLIGNPCLKNRLDVWPIVAFHHFIWTFALLGWILDDPVILMIYLSTPIVAMAHWIIDKRCFINDITVEYCDPNKVEPFRKMDRIFSVPDYVYNTIVGIGFIIASIKLYKCLRTRTIPKVRWGKKASYLDKKMPPNTFKRLLFNV